MLADAEVNQQAFRSSTKLGTEQWEYGGEIEIREDGCLYDGFDGEKAENVVKNGVGKVSDAIFAESRTPVVSNNETWQTKPQIKPIWVAAKCSFGTMNATHKLPHFRNCFVPVP
ncbi:hypothetical protein LXL04_025433 [Taraxacum kok-saghyz]